MTEITAEGREGDTILGPVQTNEDGRTFRVVNTFEGGRWESFVAYVRVQA